MVASFPPVLLMRRNIIRKRLAEAGATTPEKALTLAEAGVINPYGFRRFTEFLVRKDFIRRTADNRYYLPRL